MKQQFKEKKFTGENLAILNEAVEVIDRYREQGYKLSLRQLYYQLVSANVVPNTEQSYKRVGDIIGDARMAGLADWDMIEDRNRETLTPTRWNNPAEIVEAAARSYRTARWKNQPNYCEVMVEKQALEGVLEPVCNRLDVSFTSNKGYSSITMMFEAGQRIKNEYRKRIVARGLASTLESTPVWSNAMLKKGLIEKDCPVRLTKKAIKAGYPRMVVFYLGDHDPSGIDMTRDVTDRLQMFSEVTPIEVRRLALNMDQIDELQPPENPAKLTDSRAASYVERFGESSWELDAVAPDVLATMVEEAIESVMDRDLMDVALEVEEADRKRLLTMSQKFGGRK